MSLSNTPQKQNTGSLKLSANQMLFLEGDEGDEMYIVKSGEIKVVKREGPRSIELAKLGPGSVLGELSLLDNAPRTASARTTVDTEVAVINRNLLEKTYKQVPSWLEALVKMLVNRLRETMKRKYNRDLIESFPAFIKTLMWIENGTLPRKLNIQRGIPLALLQQEMFTFYGLQSQETVKVAQLLQSISLLQIAPSEKFGKVILIESTNDLSSFLRFLFAQKEGKKLTEEKVSDKELELLHTIIDAGESRGSKKGKFVKLAIKQLEAHLEKTIGDGARVDYPSIKDLEVLNIIAIEKHNVSTKHQNHNSDLIVFQPEVLESLFRFRELLPLFKKDFLADL